MNHRIDRFCSCEEQGTFGRWYSNMGGAWENICYTVEPPWRVDDQSPAGVPFHSCIPAGTYALLPFSSNKWGNTWAFVNPELGVVAREINKAQDWFRFACLLHIANWPFDVEGCVGPGMKLSAGESKRHPELGVRWMVSQSGDAMKKLRDILNSTNEIQHVTIRDVGLTHTFRR